MQKSTKRLLSMLVVLALVLGFAPAGILAVETKAAAGDANLAGTNAATKIAHGAEVKAWAAEINEAIKTLEGATGTAKVNQVPAAQNCPMCNQTGITWTRASGTNNTTAGSSTAQKHTHLVVDRSMYAEKDFVYLNAYNTVCILWLDPTANGGTGTKYTVTFNDLAEENDNGKNKGADVYLEGYKGCLNIAGNANMVSNSTKQPLFNFTNSNTTTLNLYGGTYRHNKSQSVSMAVIGRTGTKPTGNVNIYNDVVIGPETSQAANATGATAYCNVVMTDGTLNMYGGTIQNAYSSVANQGWNVFMQGGTFNMYGGTIQGGSGAGTGASGCNVHCRSTFNMYGGEILGGKTNSWRGGGANLYVGTGAVGGTAPAKIPVATLYGGTISGGTNYSSNGHGANINVGSINNATTETSNGYGKLVITGTALVENGKGNGTNAGGGSCRGGNIYVNQGCQLEITGGTVQNGTAGYGGNIALGNAVNTTITGCAINSGSILVGGGTLTIDPVSDITVGGSGTVKGVDVDNDDFAGHSGSITATGVTVAKDVTYNGNRYIALTGGDNGTAYTFHRLQVKLTNVTINPDKAGLYYKAEYKFDDIVAERAEAYGVFVALNQAATAESENFTSANVADATIENHTLASSSHGVYGIFKTTREPAANIAASKSVINGNPYITINWNGVDSEKYMGENVAKSLESAIQLADEKWDQITAKEDLTTWVNHWNDLGAFDANFIAALENITIS